MKLTLLSHTLVDVKAAKNKTSCLANRGFSRLAIIMWTVKEESENTRI